MDNEKLYDVYWEGPFEWEKREDNLKEHHVLYQIYGSHHLYGMMEWGRIFILDFAKATGVIHKKVGTGQKRDFNSLRINKNIAAYKMG